MAIYWIGIIVGALLYPGGFSMTGVYVSYLGGNLENPEGYRFYNACVFLTGFLLIPHFLFLYRRLGENPKFLNIIAIFFGIIGCVGFSFVGVFHQGVPGTSHGTATLFAFGGFGASALFLLIVFLRKRALKESYPSWGQLISVYGFLLGVLTLIVLLDSFSELFQSWGIPEEYFGDRFLEWWYLFVVMGWLIGILIITPDSIEKGK